MVARIVCGKNIRGVLSYNENKVSNAEAELLIAAGFPRAAEQLSFKNKLERFALLTCQNEKTKTNTLHISLNFSPSDRIDNETMKSIALDYMDSIGFGSQPFLVYRHYDAAHPHIHIATVNIASGGQRIETHNIGRNQSEIARKAIELSYGLIRAEDQVKETAYLLRPVVLEKAIYGKVATKAAISSIVREVVDTYKFSSIPELNAVLGQFGIQAFRGEKGTRMYEKKGLVYHLIDEKGAPVGVPIKASAIYSSPTLKNLELRFGINTTERKAYGQRLKYQLDKALTAARSELQFKEILGKQGIRILLRCNVKGHVYGVTFVDNATRFVFNGSDLGKAYSAQALMDRLQKLGYNLSDKKSPVPTLLPLSEPPLREDEKQQTNTFPAQDQPVIEALWDILLSDKHEEHSPNPFRRKRRHLGME